jgi:hypothetical protein
MITTSHDYSSVWDEQSSGMVNELKYCSVQDPIYTLEMSGLLHPTYMKH